jgi:nucleoside-diphosphate-sugar epimerase
LKPDYNEYIAQPEETILVTGANGFIGSRVVHTLLSYGFKRVRCFARSTSGSQLLRSAIEEFDSSCVEIVKGNLLSRDDCIKAMAGVSIVYHLAAGVDKTFPGCFLNSVVTTRNLLDAIVADTKVKRIVNISSLAVYSNEAIPRRRLMDESCEVDDKLFERHDPYAYGKAKQDEIVREYGRTKGVPYVIVRPGINFGPGKPKIPGRVGIDTFGVFFHLGLGNRMPFTYVDNCAEAIVLAGLKKDIEGEEIIIVDDKLPTSREFLRMYKKYVRRFFSIPIPYPVFYFLNYLWEKYSAWSQGQLPPAFNRRFCAAYYKGNLYSNRKAKSLLGWSPKIDMDESLRRFFAYVRATKGVK